jgi:hypothetical protein
LPGIVRGISLWKFFRITLGRPEASIFDLPNIVRGSLISAYAMWDDTGLRHYFVPLTDRTATVVSVTVSRARGDVRNCLRGRVGDFVQWASQGIDQFPEARRVRSFSPDGLYAFVEGGNSGLLVKELTVVQPSEQQHEEIPKPPTGKVPPLKPPTPPPPTMRSYSWALSGDFNAKLDLLGEAKTEEDIDALADYVDITIKALKRSLKSRQTQE